MRYVDLSATIEAGPAELPDLLRTDIEYAGHDQGARDIESLLGIGRELLRDGEGWAVETFTRLGTHNTTHVDAPWHYNSTIGGEPAATIDELPLDWFHGPGVVIDATSRDDGDALAAADLEAELERIGHDLRPGDVVLVHTGRDAFYGQPDYIARGPGVSAEATVWLCERTTTGSSRCQSACWVKGCHTCALSHWASVRAAGEDRFTPTPIPLSTVRRIP